MLRVALALLTFVVCDALVKKPEWVVWIETHEENLATRVFDVDEVYVPVGVGEALPCFTPLLLAINTGNVTTVTSLLMMGADVNKKCGSMSLSHHGRLTSRLTSFPVHLQNMKCLSPLGLALQRRDALVARVLIDNKADVDMSFGEAGAIFPTCPLAVALGRRDGELINVLLEAGADVDCTKAKIDARFFKQFLVQLFSALGLVICCNPVSSIALCCWGGRRRAVFRFVMLCAVIFLVFLLGVWLSFQNTEQFLPVVVYANPLAVAVRNGSVEHVKELLTRNANVRGKLIKESLLGIAIKQKDTKLVRLLLEHGANVEELSDSFLLSLDLFVGVGVLTLGVSMSIWCRSQKYWIMTVCYLAFMGWVILFARLGVLELPFSKSPLALAIESGSVDIVSALIEFNADSRKRILYWWSPAEYAEANRQGLVMSFLLDNAKLYWT
jgi:hypothetical protein